MTNAHNPNTPTPPDASTGSGPAGSRRSPVARRRRILMLVALALVTIVAVLANYGPVRSYVDARDRLDKAQAKVAALEDEKLQLQSQLGRLAEADYLESLAREELTYARPGEDVFIITSPDGEETPGVAGDEGDPAGNGGAVPEDGGAADGDASGVGDASSDGDAADGDASGDGCTGVEGEAVEDGDALGDGASGEPGFFERLLSGFLAIF